MFDCRTVHTVSSLTGVVMSSSIPSLFQDAASSSSSRISKNSSTPSHSSSSTKGSKDRHKSYHRKDRPKDDRSSGGNRSSREESHARTSSTEKNGSSKQSAPKVRSSQCDCVYVDVRLHTVFSSRNCRSLFAPMISLFHEKAHLKHSKNSSARQICPDPC